jgi:type III pantothenate kinase
MVTLCIDNGNTLTKLAIFKNNELVGFRIIDANNVQVVSQLIKEMSVEAAILSSVSVVPELLMEMIHKEIGKVILFDPLTLLPIENCYQTKETLGKDRLAAAVGGNYLYPETDLLIIDAGTAITYEIISKHNQYLGGNISPGLQMRLKALNYYTSKLPLLDPVDAIPHFGQNTDEAILVGVQNGLLFEVEKSIEFYKNLFPGQKVLLTGGDAKFFENKLKNTIFVVSNLVMIGLNRILNYNMERNLFRSFRL